MHCLTNEELRRGLEAVRLNAERCVVCRGDHNDQAREKPHDFEAADVVDLFLEAAREASVTLSTTLQRPLT